MSAWEDIGKSDEWYTPKYVFDALGCEFDLDAAAPVDRTHCHVPAKRFITENSLYCEWNGFVWLNPPFGGRNKKDPWLDKMYTHGNGLVLTPDRTSAPWWQRAVKKCDILLFVGYKIKFGRPDGTTGNQPGTGTTLFAYGPQGIAALLRAENKKLGAVLHP